jgi:hypothetical protein
VDGPHGCVVFSQLNMPLLAHERYTPLENLGTRSTLYETGIYGIFLSSYKWFTLERHWEV